MAERIQEFSDREKAALKAFLWLGAIFGLLMVVYYALGPFTVYKEFESPIVSLVGIAIPTLVQILSAIAVTGAFAYLFIRWRVKRWLSFPMGALLGIVAGGLSGGLTIGIMFAIGVSTGAIEMSASMQLQWMDTWWEAFGYAFAAGGAFGGLTGLPAGIVLGPVLSFYLKY